MTSACRPAPRTVEYALLAEELGFRAVWCPEIPAFGHDIWVTLARIAEKPKPKSAMRAMPPGSMGGMDY